MKILTAGFIKNNLPLRAADSHKGEFGHTLIIAGSKHYPGAAVLCANGCARSGSGLTTLAFPETMDASISSRLYPEVMVLHIPEEDGGISAGGVKTVLDFISAKKVTSVALGCGISISPDIKIFVKKFLAVNRIPVVIDADGLNSIKDDLDILEKLESKAILTPHPGEMGRLSGQPVGKIQKNREMSAVEFAAEHNVICVLKGCGTIITDGKKTFVNPTGNPGMAKGGSGDVLTGMIAAFIGQTKRLIDAACLGVYLHGLAGDLAEKINTDISMLPGDIIANIPEAVKIVRGS